MDIEKRDTPQWATDRVAKLGGNNRFGEPMFRIVWGANRFHAVGGKFKKVVMVDVDDSVPIIGEPKRQVPIVLEVMEERQLLKYFPARWWLEKWCPPELYGSSEEWYEAIAEAKANEMPYDASDYPSRGDYEATTFLGQCNHMQPGDTQWCGLCRISFGEYLSLEEGIDVFEWHIWALKQTADMTEMERKIAHFSEEKRKRKEREDKTSAIIGNAMRPKFAIQSSSQMANPSAKRSVPEAKFNPSIYVPRSRGLKQV
jgi:hypothetical protein